MNRDRFEEIKAGYESRRGTDAWGVWPEEAMRDLIAELGAMSPAVSFERFDEACRVDWETVHGPNSETPGWGWNDPPMDGVRETVHRRMRHTLGLFGLTVEEAP